MASNLSTRMQSVKSTLLPGLLAAFLLAGCATPKNNYDPLESINRPIFSFNQTVDKAVLRPVAKTWRDYVPTPVQKGVHNFFGNIGDILAIPPALLQGKIGDAGNSLGRVVINTTAGLGGLIDWASDAKIEKSNEDFGQALGYWGVPTGPYLMLPFLGPVTARDSVDPVMQYTYGPTNYIDPESARYVYTGVSAIDTRAQLLPVDKMLEEQYDQYAYLRDTYLQNRWFNVHDGKPPRPLPLGDEDDIEAPSQPAQIPASVGASAPMEASSPVEAKP